MYAGDPLNGGGFTEMTEGASSLRIAEADFPWYRHDQIFHR
jgi:hypothetical protein